MQKHKLNETDGAVYGDLTVTALRDINGNNILKITCDKGNVKILPQTNNSVIVESTYNPMTKEKLLETMGTIVKKLDIAFQTDFTEYDTKFINETDAAKPFIWMVRQYGTWLFRIEHIEEIQRLVEYMDAYRKESYMLFRYDTTELKPVFPHTVRQWAENELKKSE